ncbi:hypothetical protein [Dolichospermum sp. UHCC 0259]|nr:hypothetical protein [Dolichospermum sp. UHCC 0259]
MDLGVGSQESGVRSSGVRSQELGVRSQESGVRSSGVQKFKRKKNRFHQ